MPPAKKTYHLVQVSYPGSNDDDGHQYQIMLTGEEYAKVQRIGEKEIGESWFSDSSFSLSSEVTKAEYERWKDRLGGMNPDEYLDELDEDEKKDLKKEIKEHKGKYYLVDVISRATPESFREDFDYYMMLTSEELKGWEKAKENHKKKSDSNDEGSDDDGGNDSEDDWFPSVYEVEKVTKEEYDRFHKELTGLHVGYIRDLIQEALKPQKKSTK